MKSARIPTSILLLAFMLVAWPGYADTDEIVVASGGTIHRLQQGLYADLFPEGFEADPESSVLALEIVQQGKFERLLVPATEDLYAERPAALHYARSSNTTYILWEGLINGLHPYLHLAGYDGQTWSGPIKITGSVFADKASAELVILSEPEYVKESKLLEFTTARSAIYVAWQEIAPTRTEKYLVPIILQDGVYIGWHKSLRLSSLNSEDLETGGPRSRSGPVDADLANLMRIQPSAKDNAVVVSFTDPDTGRLVTLEFEMLPQALSAVAARVESLIQELSESSSSVSDLAARVRAAVMEYGQDFHSSALDYLADEIEALLLEHSTVAAARAPGIPEKIGVHILHAGSRVRSKGLIDQEPREIIQMGQTREGGAPYHHLKISVLADREAPEVGGPAVLFLSSTGLEALVAWEGEEAIVFRETDGDVWSDPQTIELGDNLDKPTIYRVLADRTLNR